MINLERRRRIPLPSGLTKMETTHARVSKASAIGAMFAHERVETVVVNYDDGTEDTWERVQ